MSIKITKGFNEIIALHQRIINALKAQKARQDSLYENYEEKIQEEINIPSNRFMMWTRIVQPFMDLAISSKLSDYELIEQYERYVKDLVSYEANSIITESEISELEEGFDRVIDTVLKLENKIIKIKDYYSNQIKEIQIQNINNYQTLKKYVPHKVGQCGYCGIKLEFERGDSAKECILCHNLHKSDKPFLTKYNENNEIEDSEELEDEDMEEEFDEEEDTEEEFDEEEDTTYPSSEDPRLNSPKETQEKLSKPEIEDNNEDEEIKEPKQFESEKDEKIPDDTNVSQIKNKEIRDKFQRLIGKFENTKSEMEKQKSFDDGDELE